MALVFVSQSFSKEPYTYTPLPSELFSPVQIITDPLPEPTLSVRATPSQPTPTPIVKVIATPKPTVKPTKPPKVFSAHTTSGIASWYCKSGVSRCTVGHPGGYYAAIRRDLLELRGQRVLVCSSGGCIKVTIIDCNCGPNANLIDLYWDAFNAIGNPSSGFMKVTLKW